MSNYTKTTNFATKDNLSPGNPLKIVKGTEIDTEYNNIATAVATKTDNSAAAITGGTIVGITDLAVADGGTGASTAAGALNNLLPSQTSNANKYLQTDGTNATWDAVSLSTADITGTLGVANGGTGVTTSTGTTNVVLSNSPTLVTPALGTPSAAVLTNATGLPISTGVSGLGTGVATLLATPSSANLASAITDETGSGSLVFATSPTLVTPILGTPTSGTLTNATGLPISTGVSGLGTGVATFLATPSSANLISAVTDETGTGSLVFATSPTLVTPALGTPSALVGTNITGTASGLTAGNVTTNANLTGAITSSGNATSLGSFSSANLLGALTDETGTGSAVFATSPTLVTPILGTPTSATLTNATGLPLSTGVTGTLPVVNGGTGQTSYTDGQLLIGNTTGNTLTKATLTAGSNVTITNSAGGITIAAASGASPGGSTTQVQYNNAGAFAGITGATTNGTALTLVAPVLGTPASATLTNATGLPLSTGVTGTLPVANGGSGTATPSIVAGTNITVTGTWPNQTIAASGGGASAATPTALGTVYGKQTTSGGTPFLTAYGYNAGSSTTGVGVTAVGTEALYTNSAGVRSTAMGYRAGYSNTGDNNLFVGNQTGFTNTTGTGNSFVSGMTSDNWPAGYYNTTGANNNAFGGGALTQNSTGSSNTAVGTYALHLNTTASNNTAVGYQAGKNNTTGTANVYMGYNAGRANNTGNYNIGIGQEALDANTASNNTALGYQALYANTTGAGNTALGKGAGSLITTGSNNTIIGRYDGNQGSLDIRTASNYIVLSDGDGNPRGIFNDTGRLLVATTSVIDSARMTIKGSATVINAQTETDGSYVLRVTNAAGSGVGGVVANSSSTSYLTSSDYRLKNTIAPMTGALAKVALLKPVTYKWNCDGSDSQGFIAHELQAVVPDAVVGEKDAIDDEGNIKPQGIDTSFLVATLTAAIQELKAEFDAYKASHP